MARALKQIEELAAVAESGADGAMALDLAWYAVVFLGTTAERASFPPAVIAQSGRFGVASERSTSRIRAMHSAMRGERAAPEGAKIRDVANAVDMVCSLTRAVAPALATKMLRTALEKIDPKLGTIDVADLRVIVEARVRSPRPIALSGAVAEILVKTRAIGATSDRARTHKRVDQALRRAP